MIQSSKNLIKKVLFKYIKRETIYVQNSFSQAGEDVVLDFLFSQIGLSKPVYLELGVFSPDNCSNTYKFYLRGSKGVLVEADETQIPLIKEKRPNDTILNIGVGLTNDTEADFYIFNNQGLNTFSKEEAEFRNEKGSFRIQRVVKVPLRTVSKIIEENFETYPDFLSIDIEGLDLGVLKTIDFAKHPIPIICAETCGYSENHIKDKDKSIEEFLSGKGYFVYADTYINTIFANQSWFNSVGKK
jgi:FkbM family methyltransferase